MIKILKKNTFNQYKDNPYIKGNQFLLDVMQWFSRERDGHMGKWQYFEPNYNGDPACGSDLWANWAKTDFYMLQNQAYLIEENVNHIAGLTGSVHNIFDFGPGDKKAVYSNTMPFVEAYKNELRGYISVDICDRYAVEAASLVSDQYKNVVPNPICKDFTAQLPVPKISKSIALCFGSIIGNYEGKQNSRNVFPKLINELKLIKQNLPSSSHIVIGLDGNNNENSLYESYDHEVHAAYEINVMHRIKRDLMPIEEGFMPDAWEYKMAWYPESYQFCHIAKSTADQSFYIGMQKFKIKKGDEFVVDNSYKFPAGVFQQASILAGYEPVASYQDSDKKMALHLLKAA